MQPIERLRSRLKSISSKDYGAYQSLRGAYRYEDFQLFIDQIPKDPYAPPHTGVYRAQIPFDYSLIPPDLDASKARVIAFRDFLARRFYQASSSCTQRRGTGYSGLITVARPGQCILERSSVVLKQDSIELRFFIGLPAQGRKIDSRIAETMLFQELPRIIKLALKKENVDPELCSQHLETAETGDYLRSHLDALELACFISDNAILPRKSGNSDEPLETGKAVLFQSPESLKVKIELPNGTVIEGMGIPKGITLIAGGGYHGKSTLLQTIAHGIYNHIPGDGRERSVSNSKTLKIRAYSGRHVEKVNISPFINNLPAGDDTSRFSTENASGSTSQAASLMEGLEAGADVLLMDEDTCASNFMNRDEKMQKLVKKEDEPITAFIDRAEQLFSNQGISTILVMGGSGDYFDISDTIIQMKRFIPSDVTDTAHEIARKSPVAREKEIDESSITPVARAPLPGSIDPLNKYGKKSVYATEVNRINFGQFTIDLTDVEQLVELEQTKAIMHALLYSDRFIDGRKNLKELFKQVGKDLEREGLDIVSNRVTGSLAGFRLLELACALNRLRSIKMNQIV